MVSDETKERFIKSQGRLNEIMGGLLTQKKGDEILEISIKTYNNEELVAYFVFLLSGTERTVRVVDKLMECYLEILTRMGGVKK